MTLGTAVVMVVPVRLTECKSDLMVTLASLLVSSDAPCWSLFPHLLELLHCSSDLGNERERRVVAHQALFPKNFVIFCIPGGGAFFCFTGLAFPLFFVALIGFPFAFDGVGGGSFC